MTLVYNSINSEASIIDHNSYISQLYSKVRHVDDSKGFQLDSKLFSINNTCKPVSKRKRNINSDLEVSETSWVKNTFEKLRNELPEKIKQQITNFEKDDKHTVRDLAQEIFQNTQCEHTGLSGGNNSQETLICEIKGKEFLMPPNSRFLCGCVKEQCLKLNGNKFNLLIADPPWWNKYIRRLKSANANLSYSMMYNEDTAAIPVQDLLSPNTLVAMWCTNSPNNIEAVKNIIFPNWGVEYITTWYWLKITRDLEAMCDFGVGCQKQPYERIILGKLGDIQNVPENKLIVSVPSALHSHKPPLLDILSPLLKEEPVTLELFARYLLPNTTSVGYEPLKWQHLSIYQETNVLMKTTEKPACEEVTVPHRQAFPSYTKILNTTA